MNKLLFYRQFPRYLTYLRVIKRSTALLARTNRHSTLGAGPETIRRLKKLIYRGALISIGIGVMAEVADTKTPAAGGDSIDDVIQRMDRLYNEHKLKEVYDGFQPYKELDNSEVQWRYSRVCYRIAKHHTPDKGKAKEIAYEALDHGTRSIKDESACSLAYRWRGIALSFVSTDFEGYKYQIEKSYEIRDNFLKAIELDPSNPTNKHLLGRWCYSISDVSYFVRKAATYIFATPPSSSFEEALGYFEKAEQDDPGFYSANWLYIGKCYIKLKNKAKAREWLQKVLDEGGSHEDDLDAKKEASDLLKTL